MRYQESIVFGLAQRTRQRGRWVGRICNISNCTASQLVDEGEGRTADWVLVGVSLFTLNYFTSV
jgi:hypothetical protein